MSDLLHVTQREDSYSTVCGLPRLGLTTIAWENAPLIMDGWNCCPDCESGLDIDLARASQHVAPGVVCAGAEAQARDEHRVWGREDWGDVRGYAEALL